MVGLFAALCASEGHNKAAKGNKYQTFDGKMAAVAFAHKASSGPIAASYYTNAAQDARAPSKAKLEGELLWGSIVLAFFFLDRSSELWGPVAVDRSTGTERAHCVKADNVILRDKNGAQVGPEDPNAASVEFVFESHKGDCDAQGVTVRHYRSHHPILCPVTASQRCLRIRAQWLYEGKDIGPYLTSTSRTRTVKKARVGKLIKTAAANMGLKPKDYSTHSLRIGGACALLAAGKSDLVIRLMGRWSSWCFTVYTKLRPGMIRDAASCMIKASTRECHEPGSIPNLITRHSRGELQRV
ncbi:hypothetical protein F441_14064 [Phytophthora nicotianae CJ01A1]|uniref:Tyr recombinase domain-containing protein n=1 Tax=Phytophthora nicotianae CJ01A1 TaxID=1317063 RepID=W2WJG1_PHYNI|nr:hypothetical protein F441_14064 [Phytophthora nicotianae CJ01A1]